MFLFWHGLGHGHVAEVKGIWLLALFGGKKGSTTTPCETSIGADCLQTAANVWKSVCLSLGWICFISVHECSEQRNSPPMMRHMHSWKGHKSEVDYSESAANWHSRPFPGKISFNVST